MRAKLRSVRNRGASETAERQKLPSVRNFLLPNQHFADAESEGDGDAVVMPIRTVPRNPGQYALRRGRVSLPGQRYLVTTCTANRSAWFANRNHADRTCAILRESLTWPAARVLIWVLMPDHWHGLVELHGTEALSTVFARMKGIVSRRWPDSTPRPIWQRSFHDHALRSE